MPIHDWSRVGAGIFHSFHVSWTVEILAALNTRILPSDYYALAEQVSGKFGPDIVSMRFTGPHADPVLIVPSNESTTATEMDYYARKQNTVVIRHSSGDQVVGLIEIVSPGNKGSPHGLRSLVEKAAAALSRGYHLLVVDVHPLGLLDPNGIHGSIWEEIDRGSYRVEPDKPLAVVAYEAGQAIEAYLETMAVGDTMPDMPLFLRSGICINVPLEATYRTAYSFVPQRWRRVLEGTAG